MAKRVQLENLTRDRILIPVEVGGNADDGKLLDLGDKTDVDDKVPAGFTRDTRLQPAPAIVLSEDGYKRLGSLAHLMIEDQIAQKRLRRVDLAA